jgi:hypothetical protein
MTCEKGKKIKASRPQRLVTVPSLGLSTFTFVGEVVFIFWLLILGRKLPGTRQTPVKSPSEVLAWRLLDLPFSQTSKARARRCGRP